MKRILALILALTCMVMALVSCGGNEDFDISSAKTIADLAGAKISAQSGTFHEEAREQIPDVKGTVYEDFDTMLTALRAGAIDGYIAEEPTARSVCEKDSTLAYLPLKNNDTGFTATDADVAIAVGMKKGSSLKADINAALATITAQQREDLMLQMVTLQSGGTVDSFAISNDAPATTNGTLKVAMECAYEPFNWSQTSDANGAVPVANVNNLYANGYDVQVAKYIANALGMELEIYQAEWDALIPGVNAGTYDMIIAGMSPTAERAEIIDFSDVYYTSTLVVIYKK